MNEQELNKKLAEWVGMKHDWDNEIAGYKTTESFCLNCGRAVDYTPFSCVPNFTQSLDACFKWLVPKLSGFPMIKIKVLSYGQWLVRIDAGQEFVTGEPALALCLAIENLIDNLETK